MLLYDSLSDPALQFGRDTFMPLTQTAPQEHLQTLQWEEWLKNPQTLGPQVVKPWTKDSLLAMTDLALSQAIATCFHQLFPLVLLASCEDPLPHAVSLHAPPPDKTVNQEMAEEDVLGVALFLRVNLAIVLEDIWKTEIVPYIEGPCSSASNKAHNFQWDKMPFAHCGNQG